MKNKIALVVVIASFLISCNQKNKENNTTELKPINVDKKTLAQGFNLLEKNCFSCHSPKVSIKNNVAPTLAVIKKHYTNNNASLNDFTEDLIAFLNNPSEEKSKIPDAIKQFGLMPKMNFSETEITKIAQYIYHTKLEKPDWFEKYYDKEKEEHYKILNLETTPLELGKKIAMQTKSVLGKNLIQAINSKGTEHALSFCSTRAIPLTDSMAISLNAKIKRVSDKNRNPNNKANATELEYINNSKEALTKGQSIKPQLITTENKDIAYYPIMTSKMCIQCHGKPKEDITPRSYSKIKQLYPHDNAIGYKPEELRGIWVIEMDKK